MGLHYTRKLPDLAPVQAGSIASVSIPRGPTYREIMVEYKTGGSAATEAQVKSDIEYIALKINGTERFKATGKQLIDILGKYYGETFTNGLIFIPLSRSHLFELAGIDNTAWGTANVDTFQMDVKLASGATTPQLDAHALVDPVARPLGAIVEVHDTNFNTATAGVFEISTLVKSRGQLMAMHCDNANIDAMEIAVNQWDFQNVPLPVLEALYKREPSKRVPQSGWAHYDPCFLNRLGDVVPMNAEDWRLKLDMSAAGNVNIFMETLNEPLGSAR